MIRALTPTTSRACSWVWASVVIIGGFPMMVQAQDPAPGAAPPAEKAANGDDAKKAENAAEENAPEPGAVSVETFDEPAARAAAENNFPQLSARPVRQSEKRQVESMAKSAGVGLDADLIQRYVAYQAAELTSHNNIKALLQPEAFAPNSAATRGIRDAGAALVGPIEAANKSRNAAFIKVYTQALVKEAPRLLKNHLFARLETIIALAQTGSPEALDTFVKQLNDADQTVWVKQWAARGITNIVQTPNGYRDNIPGVNPNLVTQAAKALAAQLAREDLPWTVQIRVLEALGALRMPSDPSAQRKVEFASAVLQILSNSELRPEVRAEAAWALGMMRVTSAAGNFNYPLIAYYIGEVAADLAEQVAASYESNITLSQYWAFPLVYQVYAALNGQDGASDSGLLRMQLNSQQKKFVQDVADQVKPLAKSSIDMLKSVKSGREKIAKDLNQKAGVLRNLLGKNPPAEKTLVPGGQEFPLRAQMAVAPAGNERVVGFPPAGR